jgi:hypothetical protein
VLIWSILSNFKVELPPPKLPHPKLKLKGRFFFRNIGKKKNIQSDIIEYCNIRKKDIGSEFSFKMNEFDCEPKLNSTFE